MDMQLVQAELVVVPSNGKSEDINIIICFPSGKDDTDYKKIIRVACEQLAEKLTGYRIVFNKDFIEALYSAALLELGRTDYMFFHPDAICYLADTLDKALQANYGKYFKVDTSEVRHFLQDYTCLQAVSNMSSHFTTGSIQPVELSS